MSEILSNEKIHIDKQILLNNGNPFNSIAEVYAYLDNMKTILKDDMFIYDYNNLSEIILNDTSFNLFNDNIAKLNSDDANILNFYKIIGKRVFITEETVNTKTSKIINYSYASCLVGLYKPKNTKSLLYALSKNKKLYYNTEYTLLSTDIKTIDNELIKISFIAWLNSTIDEKIDIEKIIEVNKDRN